MMIEVLSRTTVMNRKQSLAKTVAIGTCANRQAIRFHFMLSRIIACETRSQSIEPHVNQSAEASRQGSLPKSSSAVLESRAGK